MSKSRFMMMFVFIAIGAMVLFVQPALAAKEVDFTITPGTAQPGDVSPITSGANAEYAFTAYENQKIDITIPVKVCMTGYETGWTSIDINFPTAVAPLSDYTTVPANQTFTPVELTPGGEGDCRNVSITIIKTDGLPKGDYTVNINSIGGANPVPSGTSYKPQAKISDTSPTNIHVALSVLAGSANVSCFITDSGGLNLTDCEGEWVTDSASEDGRFSIVANKKVEVATNPGTFYYNFIWVNTTGNDQTIDVDFVREGVAPKGAQAIHYAVFSTDLVPLDTSVFDQTNVNGTPDGTDDEASGILVPAGWSLLVTYHLTWADLGSSPPTDIATSCDSANQDFSVTGTVSGEGITEESCESGALGYKR